MTNNRDDLLRAPKSEAVTITVGTTKRQPDRPRIFDRVGDLEADVQALQTRDSGPVTVVDDNAAANDEVLRVLNAAGNRTFAVQADGDVINASGSYGVISDAALKDVHGPALPRTQALLDLEGVTYVLHSDPDRVQRGLIAQDVEQVMPDLVGVDADGQRYIRVSGLVMELLFTVQELEARVAAIEGEKT